MRTIAINLVTIAILLLAGPALAEAPIQGQETIERVAPGIWSIHQRRGFHLQPVGNVEVIDQKRGLVLIDGGASVGSARRIARLIKSVSAKPVVAIAVTHWHADHTLGLTTLLEAWPKAELIATSATRDHILGPSMQMYPKGAPDAAKTKRFSDAIGSTLDRFRALAATSSLPHPIRAGYAATVEELVFFQEDMEGVFLPESLSVFENERVLDDSVRPLHLRFLGAGHTDGDLIGWLPKQRILVTGDLVVAPIPFGFDCYPASWRSDLDKLLAFHARTIIPGHGLPMRDDSYLKLLRDMLSDLTGRMATIGPKEGLDQASKDLASAFAPYQRRIAGTDLWLQQWFRDYWQGPLTKALWEESRALPRGQGRN
ncbi:MAG: hypothetical protein QOE79_2804 [Sphingomonadales bacterium]|nr:hypothetical protein [Sphingomonadales bacterium]MEA3048408.1 hypothetical protein [Sphingomonadales bacterium]